MSSGTCHLRNACIPLAEIRRKASERLAEVLDGIEGPKSLVLGPNLSGPLGLLIEVPFLKLHGVDAMFELGPVPIPASTSNIFYILRADDISALHLLAAQFRQYGPERRHHICFVPRCTMLSEATLVQLKVYGNVTRIELKLELFPCDDDVINLCMEDCFKEMSIDGDLSPLWYTASAIHSFQEIFGKIPKVSGKGEWAFRTSQLLAKMEKENPVADNTTSEISEIIFLDRRVDLVSVLLQQLNYEGLIDEIIGISNGFVEVDKKAVGAKGRPGMAKVPLNSNSDVFKQTRDINFHLIKYILKKRAAHIQETYEERHSAESIQQMSSFMKKFKSVQPDHAALQTHISLAERIAEVTKSPSFLRNAQAQLDLLSGDNHEIESYIEELIGKRAPLEQVLRITCLLSIVGNGLKSKTFDFLRKEIIQTYSFNYIIALDNLEQAGLLTKRETKSPFPSIRSAFSLVAEPISSNYSSATPSSMHFPYHGYAPLSIKIIESMTKPGWSENSIQEALGSLPGPLFSTGQATVRECRKKRIALVCMIGGVTFAEISALRWLNKREDHDQEYIILTTHITNGNRLMKSIFAGCDALSFEIPHLDSNVT